jgi:hypothetical protein
MRPLLGRLVTFGWPDRTDLSVFEALSCVSWKEVTISSDTAEAMMLFENDCLILPFLSSKESLRGLSLNQLSLRSDNLRELLERLSNLRSLKLGNCIIRDYQSRAASWWATTTSPLRLENLIELDVSGTKVRSSGSFAQSPFFDVPNLRHLAIDFQSRYATEFWTLQPFVSLPRTLETLQADCSRSSDFIAQNWQFYVVVETVAKGNFPNLRDVDFRTHTPQTDSSDSRLATVCNMFHPHLAGAQVRVSRLGEGGHWQSKRFH